MQNVQENEHDNFNMFTSINLLECLVNKYCKSEMLSKLWNVQIILSLYWQPMNWTIKDFKLKSVIPSVFRFENWTSKDLFT